MTSEEEGKGGEVCGGEGHGPAFSTLMATTAPVGKSSAQ